MVGSSCVVRRVDALQKPTWPSIDSGGAAVLSTWQRGFEDLSNGCGTCGEIGRYDALAVGRSAASARALRAHFKRIGFSPHQLVSDAEIMDALRELQLGHRVEAHRALHQG